MGKKKKEKEKPDFFERLIKKIKSHRNSHIYEEILEQIVCRHKKIDVLPGEYHNNLKCHMNSVHYALKKGDPFIVLCFQVPKETGIPMIHFVNIHNLKYIDNTLGHLVELNDYYFVGFISKRKFVNINNIFLKFRLSIKETYSDSWINKFFSDITF